MSQSASVAIWLAALASTAALMLPQDQGEKMSVLFTLTPRSEKWLVGARAVVDLRVENRGPGTVELPNPMFTSSPQPVFRLSAPNGSEQRFAPTARARVTREIVSVTIDPGQAWVGELIVSDYVRLDQPGVYALSAELDWKGTQVSASSTRFEIVPARFTDLSAALSYSREGHANRQLVLLQDGPSPDAIFAGLTERDPRNAELNKFNYIRMGALPAGTRRVHGVHANYATALEPLTWIIGSAAQSISVGHNLTKETATIAFARPLSTVLTPLALQGRRLLVPALVDASSGVELTFTAIDGSQALPARLTPRVIWNSQERVAVAASALSPDTTGNPWIVALARETANGVTVTLLKFTASGDAAGAREHVLPELKTAKAIAAYWDTDSRIHVSIAATSGDASVQIAELLFQEDLTIARPVALSPVWTLDDRPASSALAYFEQSLGDVRRVALFRAQSGATWVVDRRDRLRGLGRLTPASSPAALIPGADAWYILFLTPQGLAARSF